MILEHAIYGSETGLGDYRILATSPRFRERLRARVEYYSNLEWSAVAGAFVPTFSFYSLGDRLWAFARTVYLGPTVRGSEYLVHTLVLDGPSLAQIEYRPFALAAEFSSQKPARPLPSLTFNGSVVNFSKKLPNPVIAASLRALSRGPLYLRADPGDAEQICRDIHESLPPTDRMRATFCTRYSYGRHLDYQLSAFVAADEERLRAQTSNATIVAHPPPSAATPDLFDRWMREVCSEPDFDLVGPSILRDAPDAFALLGGVRDLRLWTSKGGAATDDTSALEKSSALVLAPENCDRPSIQPIVPGALAVEICRRVRNAETFAETAELSRARPSEIRRAAAQWLGQLRTEPTEAWMADLLLRLPDAPLDELVESLKRTDLLDRSAGAYRAFLSTIFTGLRDRFGVAAGSGVASIIGDLSSAAIRHFVQATEETAKSDADGARRAGWLLALVRARAIPAAVAGRIVLSNDLLTSLRDDELMTLAPALFGMEEGLAQALPSIPEGSTLDRALASVLRERLQTAWKPRTPFGSEILRRILLGASTVPFARATAVDLTAAAFFIGTIFPRESRADLRGSIATLVDRLADAGLTPVQASLLIRALVGVGSVKVKRGTLVSLIRQALCRRPKEIWSFPRRHLRLRRLREVTA
jgi:hypothetical protein